MNTNAIKHIAHRALLALGALAFAFGAAADERTGVHMETDLYFNSGLHYQVQGSSSKVTESASLMVFTEIWSPASAGVSLQAVVSGGAVAVPRLCPGVPSLWLDPEPRLAAVPGVGAGSVDMLAMVGVAAAAGACMAAGSACTIAAAWVEWASQHVVHYLRPLKSGVHHLQQHVVVHY